VGEALHATGLLPRAKPSKAVRTAAPAGPRRYTLGGCTIWVGRNAQQNDRLTFTTAKPDDFWLHARGAPGSHVVVHCPQGAPDAVVLQAAAQLAAHFSTLSGERGADVIVTQRRHLGRPRDGRPGQVLVRQEEVLHVPASLPEGIREHK
jgi:predicted ribosome quality control (RQC) complex YloA/Tae2 family protein